MIAIGLLRSSPDWRGMKLAEQLNAGPQRAQTACQVRAVYAQLDEEDQKVLRDNMIEIRDVDPYQRSGRSIAAKKTIMWLADVLAKSGYPVGRSSLSRHINGQCSCESI